MLGSQVVKSYAQFEKTNWKWGMQWCKKSVVSVGILLSYNKSY